MKKVLLTIFLFHFSGIFAQSLFEGRYVMILLNNRDSAQFIRAQEMITKHDGHVLHAFSPSIIQGYLTKPGDDAICKSGLVREIVDSTYSKDLVRLSPRDQMVIRVWNQQFKPQLATRGGEDDGEKDRKPQEMPGPFQTSEYMMGTVSVGIVFVESDGSLEKNTESWDDISKEDMFFQVRKGLEWWAEKGGYRSSLTWTYEFKDITTKFEPITHSYNDDEGWVNDVSYKLGYGTTGDGRMICFDYANDLRKRYKTDWAFVVFAAPADNDDDGNWKGGGAVAWANLGGPLLIINNRCDGWGPDRAWEVMAHETGHIFNALDEYPGGSRGTSRNGLLNVLNGNAKEGGVIDEECIMKAHGQEACIFTQGQIGWLGDNDQGVFISDYLNVSGKFNKKMMAREASSARNNPPKIKVEYEDPRARLDAERNKKFYSEDFASNARGWKEDVDSYLKIGEYSISNTTSWLTDEYEDFDVSVTVRLEKATPGDPYGMDVYSRQTNKFYTCAINDRGQFMVMSIEPGKPYYPDWQKTPLLQPKNPNTIRITSKKKAITVYINDQLIKTFEDNADGERNVGLRVDEGVRAAFDNLVIKKAQ